MNSFLNRKLEGEWPYLCLDATYLKVRESGRIVSVAAIIASAVNAEGRREIIGLGLGPWEAAVFWLGFLRSLEKRALKQYANYNRTGLAKGLQQPQAQLGRGPYLEVPGLGGKK